jgi:predicted lipoprotein with Yx(FWY)xxD motif
MADTPGLLSCAPVGSCRERHVQMRKRQWVCVGVGLLVSVSMAWAQSKTPARDATPSAQAPVVGRIFDSTAPPAKEEAAPPTLAPDSQLPAVMDRGLLVDRRGVTLYTYDGDRRPNVSTCYGICETLWPPHYATLDDIAPDGFTVLHRRDGSLQWAYRGRPLYFWKRDRKPGDVTGDKVNNVWHVVRDGTSQSTRRVRP